VVPVPEVSLGVVTTGRMLEFTVPSQAGRTFTARLARSAGSLDGRTRSMMVEADVVNRDGALAVGDTIVRRGTDEIRAGASIK